MKYRILAFLVLSFLFSCKKDSDPSPETKSNVLPEIVSLTADRTTLFSGESTNVYCNAKDDDGDQIQYHWTSDCGTFNVPNVSAVTWKAPDVYWQISCVITVTAGDSYHNEKDSKNIIITVLPQDPGVTTKTLYPTDDAYVSSGTPNENYGNEGILCTGQVDYGGAGISYYYAYLKFDVSSIPTNALIEKAELVLITGNNSTSIKPIGSTFIRWVTNSSWNEGSITYANRPDIENTVVTAIQDITFDVVSEQRFDIKYHFIDHYKLNSTYSLMANTSFISTSSAFCAFYSKEAPSSLSPELYIEYTTK